MLGERMKIVLILLVVLIGVGLTGYLLWPSAERDLRSLSSTRRVVFASIAHTPSLSRVVIDDPAEIKRIVSTIRLSRIQSCGCLFTRWADFETTRGTIHMGIAPYGLYIQHGFIAPLYSMPHEFFQIYESYSPHTDSNGVPNHTLELPAPR
jgi:hypothetical protein